MNNKILKQLAELSIANGRINESASAYVLTKLSRTDLKRYLFYLKNTLRDSRVMVRTPMAPDADVKRRVNALFAGKDIRFETDRTLGAGMQIEYGDNVINVNIRTMVEKTISQLKENL